MSGLPRIEKPRLKVILVGSSGVGKTCLIASFFKKPFDPSVMSTVSPAYMFQEVARRDGLPVCLQIWDTAGQERYRSVSQLFYRDADVAFVCYEAGNLESADTVPEWIAKVNKEVPVCAFIIVATKADLLDSETARRVKSNMETDFAEFEPKGCHVTSAVTREGVDELFLNAAELFRPAATQKQSNVSQDVGTSHSEQHGCC
jgi:small GTP-binding protein